MYDNICISVCTHIHTHYKDSQYGRRKFRSQTSDNMDRWKSRGGQSQRGEEPKREDQRRERVRRKKMQVRKKVGKPRNTVFFPMICGSGGSNSRLAKAAGAEPCGQMRDEKLNAVVARSTFPSQNVQSTPCSDHFWTFRCRFAWQVQGIVHLVKSEQNVRVLLHFQNDGRRGTFQEDLQRCIFRGGRTTRDMFIRPVRRSGR